MVQLNELFLERKVRKRIRKENKGQVESIGLVIIVVLLVLLFVLFLYFKVNSSVGSNADRVLEIKANNLRNSVLKTSLCRDISVKDEILNCKLGINACGSCDELKDKIKIIIVNSLEPNVNYEFSPYNLNRGSCKERIASSFQPIEQDLSVGISLCY